MKILFLDFHTFDRPSIRSATVCELQTNKTISQLSKKDFDEVFMKSSKTRLVKYFFDNCFKDGLDTEILSYKDARGSPVISIEMKASGINYVVMVENGQCDVVVSIVNQEILLMHSSSERTVVVIPQTTSEF